jgi:hypothetical protein
LFVITVNSGFFETLAGSSRIVKGVLSEADIISAEPAPEGSQMRRLVGTGFFDKIGSFMSKAKDIYMKVKPGSDVGKAISSAKGALPAGVAKALGDVGYGQAGAGRAGAGMRKKMLSERLM